MGWLVATRRDRGDRAGTRVRKKMVGKLKIVEETQNDDGTSNIVFDMDDEFKEWFKRFQGLKRWSDKRFQKFVLEALTNAALEELGEK